MKKLLIVAFSLLATTAFCAEKTVNTPVSNGVTTNQMTQSTPVMTQTPNISVGDSFMAAFGMGGNTTVGGAEGGNSSSTGSTVSSSVATGSAASAGAVASALNASTNVSNGSVTITTPYGNAMHK